MTLLNNAASASKKEARRFALAAKCFPMMKRQSPDVWAIENIIFGPETGVPGKCDPMLTPYTVPFMRAFDDPRYKRVVLVTAAQSGKTQAALSIIGERLDNRPAPIIFCAPTKEFCTDQFSPRLDDLIRQSTSL